MKGIVRFLIAILLVSVLPGINLVPIMAVELPDLQPIGIEVSTLYAGVANTVNVTVNKTGTAGDNSFSVRLLADEVPIATVNGDSYGWWPATVGIEWTPAEARDYTLTAIVDPDNVIPESNEDNNQVEQTVTVLPASPITVKVRVEGKTAHMWTGEVTLFNYSITDKYNDTFEIDHPTAIGALKAAADAGGLNVIFDSMFGPADYVKSVNGDGEEGLNGWLYRVNWLQPNFGAAAYTLANGDEVLWYWGAWTAQPLRVTATKTELTTAESFTAKVEAFNGTAWSPLNGATVHIGEQSFTTDADGEVKNISLAAGSYTLFADKGTAVEYTRSNRVTVVVGATLTATATLQGGSRPLMGMNVPLTLKLYDQATMLDSSNILTATPLHTFTKDDGSITITGANTTTKIINFKVTDLPVGTFNITLFTPHALINLKNGVEITSQGVSLDVGTLLEGNADDSVQISGADFSLLLNDYLQTPAGAKWNNGRCDFDCNGQVTSVDFSIMINNYNKTSPQVVQ